MTYTNFQSDLDMITPLNLVHYVESKGYTIISEGDFCYQCYHEKQLSRYIPIDKDGNPQYIYLSILYILEEINTKLSIIISWIHKNDMASLRDGDSQ